MPLGGTRMRVAGFANNGFDAAYPTCTAPGANAILLPRRSYGADVRLDC